MDRELRRELYLSLLLLGADPMLLGALEGDQDLRADLHNWNEAKVLEMEEWLATMTGAELEAAQQRIRQYREMRGNTAPQSFAS